MNEKIDSRVKKYMLQTTFFILLNNIFLIWTSYFNMKMQMQIY